jgi:hypothetical protein
MMTIGYIGTGTEEHATGVWTLEVILGAAQKNSGKPTRKGGEENGYSSC